MTNRNVVDLFALITALYPRENAFARADMATVAAWQNMLEDLPFDAVQTALRAYAATSTFPPSVSELRLWTSRIINPTLMRTAAEAWQIAQEVIKKIGLNPPEKRYTDSGEPYMMPSSRLAQMETPQDVWDCISKIGYGTMCRAENLDVMRGQFVHMWDALAEKRRTYAAMPPELRRALASGDMSTFALKEGETPAPKRIGEKEE